MKSESRLLYLAAACVLVCQLCDPARAQGDSVKDCVPALVKLMVDQHVSNENVVFFLDQLNQNNFKDSQLNTSGSAYAGYFKGDLSGAQKQGESLRRDTQLKIDQKYSLTYALSTLSKEGLEAYNNCLRAIRKPTQLSLLIAGNLSQDKEISFKVELQSAVALKGPARVDVSGANKLISSTGPNTHVRVDGDVIRIAIDNLVGGEEFTVQRRSPREPVRVTAQIAGLVADPSLEFGPVLVPVVKEIETEVSVENTTQLLARHLENGTHDFVWARDNVSPANNRVPEGSLFVGNACLCASGERVSWDAGYQTAGSCVPPSDPSSVKLVPDSVHLVPASLLKSYQCGGLPQEPLQLRASDEGAVCYGIRLSLNAPMQVGSTECAVHWRLAGKLKKKMTILEMK